MPHSTDPLFTTRERLQERRIKKQQEERKEEQERRQWRQRRMGDGVTMPRHLFVNKRQREHPQDTTFRLKVLRARPPVAAPLPPLPMMITTTTPKKFSVALEWQLNPGPTKEAFLAHQPIRIPKPEQISGAAFMATRHAGLLGTIKKKECFIFFVLKQKNLEPKHIRGGGLLDGMRMGKCQTVGMYILDHLQRRVAKGDEARFNGHPFLIIAPKDARQGWSKEFQEGIGPGVLQIQSFDTDDAGIQNLTMGQQARLLDMLREETDVIIVTYSLLALTQENHFLAHFLTLQTYTALICDEAHHIHNRRTLGYSKIIRLRADAKWFVSGTPFQNTMASVSSALRIMGVPRRELPPALDNKKKKSTTKEEEDEDTSAHEELLALGRALTVRRLRVIPNPIHIQEVAWATRQEQVLYRHTHHVLMKNMAMPDLPDLEAQEQEEEEEDGSGQPGRGHAALCMIHHLRRLCLSPYLCQNLFVSGRVSLPENLSFFPWSLDTMLTSKPSSWPLQEQAKRVLMIDLLDQALGLPLDPTLSNLRFIHAKEIQRLQEYMIHPVSAKEQWVCRDLLSGHTDRCQEKVVLFSHWRGPLERLASLIQWRQQRGLPGARGCAYVHGDLSVAQRETERARFNNDPQCGILLAMIDVNSEGLDLTVANHVVLYDPWWNPGTEFQAVSRIEGDRQQRPIYRYRLILKGAMDMTVDSWMAAIADKKIRLDKEAFPPTLVKDDEDNDDKMEEETSLLPLYWTQNKNVG